MEKLGICKVEDCENPVYIKKHQLCSKHYQQFRNQGGLAKRECKIDHLLTAKAIEKDHREAKRRRLLIQLKKYREESLIKM